jgi:hypothetical protein
MLRNNVGTQVIILGGWANGKLATIVENNNPADSWVAVIINGEHGLYSPNVYQFAESDLMSLDELQQLRAENEALKAKHSNLIAQLTVLSGNIQDSQHALYRLEQIRLFLVEVEQYD